MSTVRQLLEALEADIDASAEHHASKSKGGQHVPPSADFAHCPPSALRRLARWVRELQSAEKESADLRDRVIEALECLLGIPAVGHKNAFAVLAELKALRGPVMTPEKVAELRAEGEELSKEIARRAAPMKRGPFGRDK